MRLAIILLLGLTTSALASFPIIFTWANRIAPTLPGLPFAFLWQIRLVLLGAFSLACWYLLDSKSRALDLGVTPE